MPTLRDRACGVLLHPTSLPGDHGCGDLGPEAFRFVDCLAAAGQRWWQMLPIGPPGPGNSPYNCLSAFAGSPLLVSLDRLADEGLLERSRLRPESPFPRQRVAYPAVTKFRYAALRRAFECFRGTGERSMHVLDRFRRRQDFWLGDFALFMTLKRLQRGRAWTEWSPLRGDRRDLRDVIKDGVAFECFVQWVFDRQWRELLEYAAQRGVGLIGDVPIFVAHDSADTWANSDLFLLDSRGRPKLQSGYPPDAFSKSGQLWGHAHYNWRRHRATRFAWWIRRFRHTLRQFDAVRIDHFLGFHRCWAVPGGHKTAARGHWIKTPGDELLTAMTRAVGHDRIIAEDLGQVTPQAVALREKFGFPGMRILQWAFGADEGARFHQPHSYPHHCVVYPGTHDNDTFVGWYRKLPRESARSRSGRTSASPGEIDSMVSTRERFLRYTGSRGQGVHWDIVRVAYQSPANTAIIQMQDLLGLGSEARMNVPAVGKGNWEWRLGWTSVTDGLITNLRALAEVCQRC